MHRWRKPPIFAFAYISRARSSKRRMSSIRPRIARHVSASGSPPTGATLLRPVDQPSHYEGQRPEERDDRPPLAGVRRTAEEHDEYRDRDREPGRDQGKRVFGLPL